MFENLIVKFISQSANLKELSLLMKYLNKEENLDTFKSFVKINYYSIYTMQNVDRKEILETIQKRILNEQKKIHRKKI